MPDCFQWPSALANALQLDDVQVSVVDELGIPVKFVGVGEGLEDLQPFDAREYVEALFPSMR